LNCGRVLRRHELGHAFHHHLARRHAPRTFGLRFGHLFQVTVAAVVEDEHLCHC
jgi:hypothetical protein